MWVAYSVNIESIMTAVMTDEIQMAAKRPRRNVRVAKGLAAKRQRRIGRGETAAAKRPIPF
jgi:hypothetical protein